MLRFFAAALPEDVRQPASSSSKPIDAATFFTSTTFIIIIIFSRPSQHYTYTWPLYGSLFWECALIFLIVVVITIICTICSFICSIWWFGWGFIRHGFWFGWSRVWFGWSRVVVVVITGSFWDLRRVVRTSWGPQYLWR